MKAGRQNALRRLGFATVCVLAMVWMAQPATAITQEEVITLSKLGIAPEEIIKAIEKDRTVFDLSVADILALKKASIDEGVLKFMLQTAKRFASDQGGSGASSAPTPNARPEPEVVEETPEERAAREERMRQEALRLKEEQRKQEEATAKIVHDFEEYIIILPHILFIESAHNYITALKYQKCLVSLF